MSTRRSSLRSSTTATAAARPIRRPPADSGSPACASARPSTDVEFADRENAGAGGTVIERAAIVAEGADSEAVIAWIVAHGGRPEAIVETSSRRGLHGSRLHDSGGAAPRAASGFVLPAGARD